MKLTDDERYLSLIFIILASIISTLITIFIFLEPIKQFFIPSYLDCYQVLKNIDKIDKKLLSIFYFYIAFFSIYFIMFTMLLIKLLKQQKIHNIYLTASILIIFNSSIMGAVMYITYEAYKTSQYFCEITKDSCIYSYAIINNLEYPTNTIHNLEKIKPCLLDVITYIDKAEQISKKINSE